MEYAALLFGMLLLLMIFGVPISFSILSASTLFLFLTNIKPFLVIPQRLVAGMDNFPMLALPLFILSGYMMEEFGLSKRLIGWVEIIFGRIRGAQGSILIVASAIFAALTGSGPATVAAIGGLMIPGMLKSGYPEDSAVGLAAVSGTLGPIIPPSGVMIVYGATMGVSVTKLFMAGMVPGILIAVLLVILNTCLAKRWGVRKYEERYTFKQFLVMTWKALGVLLLPFIVLGGIYGGIFTPTEAGTISVVYCFVLGIAYHELDLKTFYRALKKTVETGSAIMLIIAASSVLGLILSTTRIPQILTEQVLPFLTSKIAYLAILTIVLLLVGTLMEAVASVVVLAPILCPIGIALGIDPLHLGAVFCINLVMGFVTPPFGVNLFTATSISSCSFEKIVKGSLPFLGVLLAVLLLITFIPQITLFLPQLVFGN